MATPTRASVQTTSHGNAVVVPEFNVAAYQSLLAAPAPSASNASRPSGPAAAKASALSDLDWLVCIFFGAFTLKWGGQL